MKIQSDQRTFRRKSLTLRIFQACSETRPSDAKKGQLPPISDLELFVTNQSQTTIPQRSLAHHALHTGSWCYALPNPGTTVQTHSPAPAPISPLAPGPGRLR